MKASKNIKNISVLICFNFILLNGVFSMENGEPSLRFQPSLNGISENLDVLGSALEKTDEVLGGLARGFRGVSVPRLKNPKLKLYNKRSSSVLRARPIRSNDGLSSSNERLISKKPTRRGHGGKKRERRNGKNGNYLQKKFKAENTKALFEKLLSLEEYGDLSENKFYRQIGNRVVYSSRVKKGVIPYSDIVDVTNSYINTVKHELNNNALIENKFFIQKKELVKPKNECCVVGDIHGSIHSLVRILQDLIKTDKLDNQLKIKNDNFRLVCTGDYVDRGFYGSEVLYLLLRLKLANWDKVFLLRGNHESIELAKFYGFTSELARKYRQSIDLYQDLFNHLPQALFLKNNDKWLAFCHGGLDNRFKVKEFLDKENAPVEICNFECDALYTGFLWYDICKDGDCYSFTSNGRGIQLSDLTDLSKCWSDLNIGVLCRGHQHLGPGLKGPDLDDLAKKAEILISSVNTPVFTFSTATEGGVTGGLSSDVFYGIIQTDPDYKEWKLIPHLIERKKVSSNDSSSSSTVKDVGDEVDNVIIEDVPEEKPKIGEHVAEI